MEIAKRGSGYAEKSLEEIDRWMLSAFRICVEATEAMEDLMVRRAIHAIFYNLNQDLQWYLRRVAVERKDKERQKRLKGYP